MVDVPAPTVLVLHPDTAEAEALAGPLRGAGFNVRAATNDAGVFETIYEEPPHCLVLPVDMPANGVSLLEELKRDNLYGHLPAVVVVAADAVPGMDWSRVRADDYVTAPVRGEELVSRVRLSIARAQRDINANPLTGLPGNLTIMREAERRLEEGVPFALAYLDIDHFKSFNDRYGFSRGDEVLRMTGRILVNAMRVAGGRDAYVGHVGGDDFVFMTPSDLVEPVCNEVIRNFDVIVPNFYDAEDRARGYIDSVDRQDNPRRFPLMSCSIAVVDTANLADPHLADISARSAEVKKLAKSLEGSQFLLDRRR